MWSERNIAIIVIINDNSSLYLLYFLFCISYRSCKTKTKEGCKHWRFQEVNKLLRSGLSCLVVSVTFLFGHFYLQLSIFAILLFLVYRIKSDLTSSSTVKQSIKTVPTDKKENKVVEPPAVTPAVAPAVNSSISSLLGAYGSDSDSS
jgi:hypothetical protein